MADHADHQIELYQENQAGQHPQADAAMGGIEQPGAADSIGQYADTNGDIARGGQVDDAVKQAGQHIKSQIAEHGGIGLKKLVQIGVAVQMAQDV